MNLLEVTYDEDGTVHYWRDKEEVPEADWKAQHPLFKNEREINARQRNPDSRVQRQRDQRERVDNAEQSGDGATA